MCSTWDINIYERPFVSLPSYELVEDVSSPAHFPSNKYAGISSIKYLPEISQILNFLTNICGWLFCVFQTCVGFSQWTFCHRVHWVCVSAFVNCVVYGGLCWWWILPFIFDKIISMTFSWNIYDTLKPMECVLNIEVFLGRAFVYLSGLPMVSDWFV